MHLPAVQHQFSRGADSDVSCHSLSLSFLAVYCLPLWVTVMMPPGAKHCVSYLVRFGCCAVIATQPVRIR